MRLDVNRAVLHDFFIALSQGKGNAVCHTKYWLFSFGFV
jgi:hypothetical protein